MNIFQAIVLGFVQGITEFLPVSSSGHLVFLQNQFPGFSQPAAFFDVILHAGTLLAVVIYFWRRILTMKPRMVLLLLLATVPAGFAGVVFNDFLEKLFSAPFWVGPTIILTGVMNLVVGRGNLKIAKGEEMTWLKALLVGVLQAVAIIPGISRSSATIFGGVVVGISRKEAAEFSFLLSIPAIGGAIALELLDHGVGEIDINYLIGAFIAFIVGYLSIGFLLRMIEQRNYKYFAYYCFVAGLTMIILTR